MFFYLLNICKYLVNKKTLAIGSFVSESTTNILVCEYNRLENRIKIKANFFTNFKLI